MLDKNPENILTDDLQEILKEFASKNPNIILCSNPFLKSQFLIELINSVDYSVIYLDFDLLYSGYVFSGMISKNEKVDLYQPEKNNIEKIFSDVAKKISEKKYLIVLDSLNGFYNIVTGVGSGIFINAVTMLLTSVARHKNSMIVIPGMARRKENEGWVLLPGGRHIIESKYSGLYFIRDSKKPDFKIIRSS